MVMSAEIIEGADRAIGLLAAERTALCAGVLVAAAGSDPFVLVNILTCLQKFTRFISFVLKQYLEMEVAPR